LPVVGVAVTLTNAEKLAGSSLARILFAKVVFKLQQKRVAANERQTQRLTKLDRVLMKAALWPPLRCPMTYIVVVTLLVR